MNESFDRGNLAETPLSRVFFHLWENRSTGCLTISLEDDLKTVFFSRGDLALAAGSFSEIDFQKRLLADRILSAIQAEDCLEHCRRNGVSFVRALIEKEALPPGRAWQLLIEFWFEGILPLFDRDRGDYRFEPDLELAEERIFASLPTLEFILHGIRRMRNHRLIEACLPAESESIQPLFPSYAAGLGLAAYEKHIHKLMAHSSSLADLYTLSQAGKKETQKAVFALIELGLAGLSQIRNQTKTPTEIASPGLEKIWSEFNEKCSFIYKYISKEIGPVALSVLQKALEEVRAQLAPPLQGLYLRPDGRIEFKPFPLVSLNPFQEESRKIFLGLLNEILAAEVLAVKKTLGNAHEAAVVKNLEKIGELA